MLLIKLVFLIRYSDKKIIFRKIVLIFGLQNWLWKLKISNFLQSSIKWFYKILKNSRIEFHLHHWEIPQPSSYYYKPIFIFYGLNNHLIFMILTWKHQMVQTSCMNFGIIENWNKSCFHIPRSKGYSNLSKASVQKKNVLFLKDVIQYLAE